jgi:hypothetical protein
MSGFRSINEDRRSTSSYEEDDDEFGSYDTENAGRRTRGGFNTLDASAYEANKGKCKRMVFCAAMVTLLVGAVAAAYYGYTDFDSNAAGSNTHNYTSSYGLTEGADQALATVEGVPPMPTVDLMGLCAEEYLVVHGNKKCRDNCLAGACCFDEDGDDNCKNLDGADVICNMYGPCKDVIDQPETEEPSVDEYGENGMDEYGVDEYGAGEYGVDENGMDEYGVDEYGAGEYGAGEYGAGEYGAGEYGVDEYGVDEYGVDENGMDEYGMDEYGQGAGKDGLPEINIDNGDLPDGGGTDFEHAFDSNFDDEAPKNICGNKDKVTDFQTCSDAFCESADECVDPDYPLCLKECGDEFMNAMVEMMEAVEEVLPNELKSFCVTALDEYGDLVECDSDMECTDDSMCEDGFECSAECGAILYEGSEGNEALGVCGISSADLDEEPTCDPKGIPCFNNEDCENGSTDGEYAECVVECMDDMLEELEYYTESEAEVEYYEVEVNEEVIGGEGEGLPSGMPGPNGESPTVPLYCAIANEYEDMECVDLECSDDPTVCEALGADAECSLSCSPEAAGSGGSESVDGDENDEHDVDEGEDVDETEEDVDEGEDVDDTDNGADNLDGPAPEGMQAVEGFGEDEISEAVLGYCGHNNSDGELKCTDTFCEPENDDCGGELECLTECAP